MTAARVLTLIVWLLGAVRLRAQEPATQNQPCLDVQERDGQIEVKARD